MMRFHYPIYSTPANCQDCYKCIRRCPVKAISVVKGHAQIVEAMCILCGRCVINCPSFAKRPRNDTERVKQLMQGHKKVFISLAPSYIAELSEFTPRQLEIALKQLGFFAISETALGADLVSAQIADDLQRGAAERDGQKLVISSTCPSVVEYIKRYAPSFTPYITSRASPLLVHARLLRKHYGNDIGVVFAGPCIARKREADQWKEIDAAITFHELRSWFKDEGISGGTIVADREAEFVPCRAGKGALFPLGGAMITALNQYSTREDKTPPFFSIAVSGIDQIKETLQVFDPASLTRPLFLDLLSCDGGCINGPGMTNTSSGLMRRVKILEYGETASGTLNETALENDLLVSETLLAQDMPQITHTEGEIRSALRLVGKFTAQDELNCSSCGYETCRDFAGAMLDNRAERTMCTSYMRLLAQKKANGLIRAIPSGVVIADKNLKIVECNQSFARLMGQDIEVMFEVTPGLEGVDLRKITGSAHYFKDVLAVDSPEGIECDIREGKKILHINVFVVEKGEIAAGVIEDITVPQIRRDETISRAQKIIDKNVATVQKIAFLLGENAAETESILYSIIDSYSEGADE
ncbi:MAG: PAS domain-containing protein [Treponema sp.]|jgi:iron only hydrogenase large subunit-like protein/PAS domain-containing protein|nr:PAS domain-containing protein [Treponema sp.]